MSQQRFSVTPSSQAIREEEEQEDTTSEEEEQEEVEEDPPVSEDGDNPEEDQGHQVQVTKHRDMPLREQQAEAVESKVRRILH